MKFLSVLFAISSEHKIALSMFRSEQLFLLQLPPCFHTHHQQFPHVSGSSNLAGWKVFPIWKVFQIKVSSASPQMEKHHPQEDQNAKVWNIDFFTTQTQSSVYKSRPTSMQQCPDEVAMNEILDSIEGIRGRGDILGSRRPNQPCHCEGGRAALTCPHISSKMPF